MWQYIHLNSPFGKLLTPKILITEATAYNTWLLMQHCSETCRKAYHTSKRLFMLIYCTASQMMAFSVSALPGWSLSGVRGRAGSVSRATVHEGHAQQTGWRLTVLLILVHVILSQASHKQPWATRLIHHLIWVKSRKCLEGECQLHYVILQFFFIPSWLPVPVNKVDMSPHAPRSSRSYMNKVMCMTCRLPVRPRYKYHMVAYIRPLWSSRC